MTIPMAMAITISITSENRKISPFSKLLGQIDIAIEVDIAIDIEI